jgi:peptidoglycan/xylan/chitin deacetylase (PgdA/CDA1 family)
MPGSEFGWPNGKRIAFAVSAMLETWSDGKAPPYSVQATALRAGTPDHSSRTWGEYGGRVGVWRILRTLDAFGIKATFLPNAKSAELYPDAIRRVVESGHGLAAHGVAQDQLLAYMTPQEQRAAIAASVKTIEAVAGQRPDGWVSPVLAWTPETLDLLIEEKLLWYGDPNYTDLPQRLTTSTGSIVGIPTSEFTGRARAISTTSTGTPSITCASTSRRRFSTWQCTAIGAGGP